MSTTVCQQPLKPFADRVITLTGAASGIGRATAEVLWDRGATLSISDINQAGLVDVEEALKRRPHQSDQRILAEVVDITNADAVNAWINATMDVFGGINHAANIAGGVSSMGSLADKDFTIAIDLNLRGAFNCMRAQISSSPVRLRYRQCDLDGRISWRPRSIALWCC